MKDIMGQTHYPALVFSDERADWLGGGEKPLSRSGRHLYG